MARVFRRFVGFVMLQCSLLHYLSAQEVVITKIQLKDNEAIINYDLKDDILERKYALFLYSSQDNFIQPLEKVSGDVGVNLSVGGNKKIVWKPKEEFGEDFVGQLAFELKGSVYVPFIFLDGFDDYKELKRGKPYDLVWSGGRGDNVLNFELYKGENKVAVLEERPNVGNTKLILPVKVKPGKDYRLKISDKRNRDEVVFTEEFTIRRKVPLALKLGVFFTVGVATGLLIDQLTQEDPIIPAPGVPTR
ncbi:MULTISPECIES: hypothetical protein [unclassified Imperialibacter]|uniref:hypothetical protein n=1 Tax=unclassified Imperialibacter TaxID=2629706 RepID=UPI00125A3F9F|nr:MULTISPECIES: hypothetical protein [unclassified Imperialibacter]CAD5293128.1 conserved hypothetical protein [Imperialibacter sp. 89]CAD5294206.1 conserved hypothetical protein [Imperialibacter sp. 75]VVT18489.1 conserved hypothetical protein [Imperialibacter sp. EC-SDR9]